jgi:hypothetical protein
MKPENYGNIALDCSWKVETRIGTVKPRTELSTKEFTSI